MQTDREDIRLNSTLLPQRPHKAAIWQGGEGREGAPGRRQQDPRQGYGGPGGGAKHLKGPQVENIFSSACF